MERSMLMDELVHHLEYKLDKGKRLTAKWEFTCPGCDTEVGEGEEFIYLGCEKCCIKCMEEAIREAKEWAVELDAQPAEEKSGDQGDESGAGSAAGGESEML